MRKLRAYIYRFISQKFMDGCSNYNSLEVRKGCRSKAQARAVFKTHNIPHAQGQIFFSPHHAFQFVKEHGFPVVIKPNVSGFSRGSYFPINNRHELLKAIFLAKLWWPTTVIEQYLKGANYRVLATPNRILSVIERFPPHVIGDGNQSIRQLVAAENQIREQMGLYPVMKPLKETPETRAYLKKQKLNFDSIPDAGHQVNLFHRIALAPGGTVDTISVDQLPKENIALFQNIVRLFDANVLGIDVIFEHNIRDSWQKQRCIFIEVNSRPYMKMHEYPRHGEKANLEPKLERLNALNIADTDIF